MYFEQRCIAKIRFMKKFAKKNFKSFWAVIFEVSKYILNKKIFEKIFQNFLPQNLIFSFQGHNMEFTI